MKTFYFLLPFILFPLFLCAQPTWEGGLFLGISNYQGDLTKHSIPELAESNLAIGLVGRRHFNYYWALRGNLYYGQLSGDDNNYFDRKGRGISFKTPLVEFAVMGEFEPMGRMRYRSGRTRFQKLVSPYFNAGFGFIIYDPKTNFDDAAVDVLTDAKRQDASANYSKLNFVIPMSAGLKIDLSEKWLLNLELGFRYPFSDYMDGVSQAGNPKKNDWYLFGGPMLTHRFR
jgi:OmpA-OmpF porin, OOP family